ncbi:MAG: MBG domain-containing protein, partial [Bacillales bacterium]|nr:MBG domain-containing protein [Bacillales bacterium]
MDNKRNVAAKTLLVLSCAFLLGLTSCTKKHHPSSDTTSSAPISETTSESTSEGTSDTTTSEGTSDSTTSEVPSTDVSSGDTSSENPSSEEVLLDFGENVKLSDKTVTYNGEEQTLTVENLPQGAVVTYEGTHKFTNAGEYTIRATVSKEGYNNKVVSAKLTIAKAKVEVPTAKTNLVYTGEAIVGVEANALYTVTGGSAVEAGTHEATVTLKDTTNYEWASEFDGKVSYTIAKAEISVSGVTAPEMSVVDTGNAINFVVNGVPSNVKATVTYYSDEAMTTPVSEAKEVGVYFVKVELSSTSANHTLVGTTTLTSKLTIRENNTGVTFAGDELTYDGTAKTITVDMTNAKADGNFEVTYFSNEACTEAFTAATNAGTYTVYAKVVD